MDTPIRSIVIDAENDQNLRYEVFEPLNRGAMGLNEQEFRNCVYRGPFCDLLAELENDSTWRRIKGTEKPESRFVEREKILRFLAFTNRLNDYKIDTPTPEGCQIIEAIRQSGNLVIIEAIRQSGNLVNCYPSRRSAGHTHTRTCHDA